MTRERELLKRCLDLLSDEGYKTNITDGIEELLAQPDHTVDTNDMVEPVAWTDEEYSGLMTRECREMHKSYLSRAWRNYPIPLYLNPQNSKHLDRSKIVMLNSTPKREPLSEEEVVRKSSDYEYKICRDAFVVGVRWAEAQHNIEELL